MSLRVWLVMLAFVALAAVPVACLLYVARERMGPVLMGVRG